ncbi:MULTISPECIES: alkyl sulfatase C-terminal domain-containing protein [Bacillus]|uniref:alkyl sulfatase C-terminal domain-containing protein n=1 Tax=Bacillus TaxID=1386 RepID=UPI000312156F|nr:MULTISPECIES: alkyl sulfatase C-terminal domain-containing protein [Bacillus]
METILRSLLASIQNREQLQVLLKKAHTRVIFSDNEQRWHLFLSNNEVHTQNTDKGTYQILIFGEKKELEQLLCGEISLRQLQRLNKIKIQGNYRQVLLLEALLLLSRGPVVV